MTFRFAAAMALVFALTAPVSASDLALARVLLSSGGVAYYEFEAEVTGDATLSLDVRLAQVDDVLKSIVVFDDQGGVGAIRLPGREPVAELFRDMPFGPEALASPVRLLNALKGAEIAVSGGRALAGRLIAAEAETVALPDGGTVTRHRVSLLTGDGMRQFVLEEVDAVRFTDPALQGQVQEALAGLAAHRTRDRRTLTVEARGSGTRMLRVGYVVAAPLWKASYRLSLADDGMTGRLLGWSVIENMSGQDWDGVELTLASGNPVTFRQALYTAYFVHRPEVPVEVLGRVLPPADSGAVGVRPQEMAVREYAPEGRRERADMGAGGGLMAADMMMEDDFAPPPPGAPEPRGMAQTAIAATSEAVAAQVTFRIAEPVSVASGQSLMVPIIDAEVPAEALSLYQPATHARHPLASVELENTGETGLPPGVLTLYSAGSNGVAYVGDARLAPMPAGETRLISFALDQDLIVDREDGYVHTLVGGGIAKGVLRLRYRDRSSTTYRIRSSAKESRRIVIEHPRSQGWELTGPQADKALLTDSAYRLEGAIPPRAERALDVVLERPVHEEISVSDMWRGDLEAYIRATELSDELRAALQTLAALRAEVELRADDLDRIANRQAQVYEDQDRLRENMRRVSQDSDLYQRYMAKLASQEDTLDALLTEEERAQAAFYVAEQNLAEAIAEFEI